MTIKFNPKKNISEAISKHEDYCNGFGSQKVGSYVLGIVLSVGVAKSRFSHPGSQVLDEINAFDLAEVDNTYIGQINMSTASSFCGPQGIVWGYDAVRAPRLKRKHPLLKSTRFANKNRFSVFSLEPLLKATRSLFGTVNARRFPLIPGSHVPVAGRSKSIAGPGRIYAGVALGIPKDRGRNACLLMEDAGLLYRNPSDSINKVRKKVLENLVGSILAVGENQQVEYKEVFVGLKDLYVNEGEIGCALVAAPYFTLAQKALIGERPEALIDIGLRRWENQVKENS